MDVNTFEIPVEYNGQEMQAASYKIRAIPKAFLIDRNGIVVKIFNGNSKVGKAFLENKIQELTK